MHGFIHKIPNFLKGHRKQTWMSVKMTDIKNNTLQWVYS